MLAEDLGIGTTDDIFHFEGTFPLACAQKIEKVRAARRQDCLYLAAKKRFAAREVHNQAKRSRKRKRTD